MIPICPYCNEEVTDTYADVLVILAFDEGDGEEIECGNCGRAVMLHKRTRVEIIATKIED